MKGQTMTEAERLRKMGTQFGGMADAIGSVFTTHDRKCVVCGGGPVAKWLRDLPCPTCLRLAATACVRLAETMENGVTR